MRKSLMRLGFPTVTAITVALSGLGAGTATADAPLPYHIDWSLAAAAASAPATIDQNVMPPGANDWNCKPTALHPDPVILLSGINVGPGLNFMNLSPLLKNNSYCVFTLTYGVGGPAQRPGFTDVRDVAATELAPFVDKVLTATGAAKVDFLGHSEGTIMPRWYLNKLGGDRKVARSVNLAPMWQGTTIFGVATPANAEALKPLIPNADTFVSGSEYLNEVNSGESFPRSVEFTSIVTIYDEEAVPYTTGIAPAGPNISNIVLQNTCPTDLVEHNLIAVDPVTAQFVLNALDPAHAVPVDCTGVPRNSR